MSSFSPFCLSAEGRINNVDNPLKRSLCLHFRGDRSADFVDNKYRTPRGASKFCRQSLCQTGRDEERVMQKNKEKGSWTKPGIFAAIFCSWAGLTYGFLYYGGCPCTPTGLATLTVVCSLSWVSVGFLLWALFQKQFLKLALTLFVAGIPVGYMTLGLVSQYASTDYHSQPKSPPAVYPKSR